MPPALLRSIIAGKLSRDYVILPSGQVRVDVPGGNALYAAAGLAVWEADPPPGLVARVGEDYPALWLDDFARRGFDTRGVRILPEPIDLRSFYAFTDWETRLCDDPVAHFARLGHPFPQSLLGYRLPTSPFDTRTHLRPISLRQADLPEEYLLEMMNDPDQAKVKRVTAAMLQQEKMDIAALEKAYRGQD